MTELLWGLFFKAYPADDLNCNPLRVVSRLQASHRVTKKGGIHTQRTVNLKLLNPSTLHKCTLHTPTNSKQYEINKLVRKHRQGLNNCVSSDDCHSHATTLSLLFPFVVYVNILGILKISCGG